MAANMFAKTFRDFAGKYNSNENMADFFKGEALTFDDSTLNPLRSDFVPQKSADSTTYLTQNIELKIPLVSAPMDTITEKELAIVMAENGGIGIIHKNMAPREHAKHVAAVKYHFNVLIDKPKKFRPNQKAGEALRREAKYGFSSFPIVDNSNVLVGIITSRHLKYAIGKEDAPIEKIMDKRLVTGSLEMSVKEAYDKMMSNEVGCLPLTDKRGRLRGMYTLKDVRSVIERKTENYALDSRGQLRVGAAVGVLSALEEERIGRLVKERVDVLVIDTAHGHSQNVVDTIRFIKKNYPSVDVIAGNIVTAEAARELISAGADAVKVGVGVGSICTTRVVAGVGVPQLTAVYRVAAEVKNDVPVIADGGIRYSGDITKAIAAGAHCVMSGRIFAGTDQCASVVRISRLSKEERKEVQPSYRGMGSPEAMMDNREVRGRYSQKTVTEPQKMVSEGVSARVDFAGPAETLIYQMIGGLKQGMGYCGSRTILQLQQKAKFDRVSLAGLIEAHPHDLPGIISTPNYAPK